MMMNKRKKQYVVRGCLVAFALGVIFIPRWAKQNSEENKAHRSMIAETEVESFEETEVVEETASVSTEDLQTETDAVASTITNVAPAASAPAPTATGIAVPATPAPAETAPTSIVWGTGETEAVSTEASGPVVSDETPDASELPPIKDVPEDTETTAAATEANQVVIEQPGESSETAPAETEPETAPTKHQHLEVQQGNYLMIYCTDVTKPYSDGFTIYRPWEDRPY